MAKGFTTGMKGSTGYQRQGRTKTPPPPDMSGAGGVAGPTGLRATGQMQNIVAPQDMAPYNDKTAELNARLADACEQVNGEHKADYEKFGAVYQGVNPLPDRAVTPASGGSDVVSDMNPQVGMSDTLTPRKV